MFNLSTLRVLVAVAECGGIRGAAQRLARTPSAISMALKQLEADVGVPLFQGDRKSLLTPIGGIVLEEARQLLAHFDLSRNRVRAIAGNASSHVDIACPPSVAVSLLSEVIKELATMLPSITVRARDMHSRSVIEAVAAGTVDLGICHYVEPVPRMTFRPLFSDRMVLVCAKDHPLARCRTPVSWRQLQGQAFLAHGSYGMINDPLFRRIVDQARVEVPNAMSLFALVKAKVGVTVLSALLAQSDQDVRFVPLADPRAYQVVATVSRSGQAQSPSALAFVAALDRVLLRMHDALGVRPIAERPAQPAQRR